MAYCTWQTLVVTVYFLSHALLLAPEHMFITLCNDKDTESQETVDKMY